MAKKSVGVNPPKNSKNSMPVIKVDEQDISRTKLTKLERLAKLQSQQSVRLGSVTNFGNASGGSIRDADSSFYSPQLSTDFLELPQSDREKRELFRFWYQVHPIVGSAIDFHCFPPGAPVSLIDGSVKFIEDLKVGDKVLNGLGEKTEVVGTFSHDVDTSITKIKVRGVQDIIDCTQNHPFRIYTSDQVDCKFPNIGMGACKSGTKNLCKQRKCEGIDFGASKFIFAQDLKVGDYICSPSMVSSNKVLNKNQLRLLGYYAAEGSLSYTDYGKNSRIEFTLNSNGFNTVAEEISKTLMSEYEYPSTKKIREDSNSCYVRVYRKDFADFCSEHVGSGSLNKKLSSAIMDSPREDILEFLGAYWNGDGSLTKNGYVATTVSMQLAHQIHALALKVGYGATLHRHVPKTSTGFKYTDCVYRVIVPYKFHEEFSKYANFVQDGYTADSTREYFIKIDNDILRRIESIETVHYKGPVYNIEVDGEGDRKSYIAYGLSTHNTDVPMSKLRLSLPKGKDVKRNKQIQQFFQRMSQRIRLFQTLHEATHEYWLHGIVFLFAEDHDLVPEIPKELVVDSVTETLEGVDWAGRSNSRNVEKKTVKPDEELWKNISEFVQKNYQGWQRLQILPPEQVKTEVFQYTNRMKMELIPSDKDKMVVMKAKENDPEAQKIADDIPHEIRESLENGTPIPLSSSPYDDYLCSSFCYQLAHKKSPYDTRGISLLERCLRTLLKQDKLRQAQTSIASRAMTPKRIVWADKLSEANVEDLRDQVDQALIDPDFTIVTNFEVHWDEIGARDRLLDLSSEYEMDNKLLFIGLRITESMLTGESSYAGERIHLDVMNTMYLLYREQLADYVENYLFLPVAKKKGFFEIDENTGEKIYLYPQLQFTRLALRDQADTMDVLFNLYQKGSLPVSFILDLLNIDPSDTLEQLKADMFGPNDSTFNEFIRNALQKAGDAAIDSTNIMEIVARNAGLTIKKQKEEGDRFGEE
jgi:hypothetical protein